MGITIIVEFVTLNGDFRSELFKCLLVSGTDYWVNGYEVDKETYHRIRNYILSLSGCPAAWLAVCRAEE